MAADPRFEKLPADVREGVEVLSQVLPFRTNSYVADLVDWDAVPDDPIFQLTFPQREMLAPEAYERVASLLRARAAAPEIRVAADEIRLRMNPHPAGQLTHNVPKLDGRPVEGVQHKYRETVLYFPSQGQTCHAYCTYCFRWPQFVGMADLKFEARASERLQAYLRRHPEVTDVLVTGGDPMIMKTASLRAHLEPLLAPDFAHLRSLRIGTKALAYWPQRFVTDDDADDVLRFFERVVASGRQLAVMAHFSHPRELSTALVREAIRRIRSTGAQIRMQAPLVRRVNDAAETWAEMWRTGVQLGLVPYYMFVERDTGPKNYFEVPLARAYQIFRDAYQNVSGLARTVRGPSMSAHPGKVRVLGVQTVAGQKVFVLDLLQARNHHWVRRPFFAKFSRRATWFSDLRPAFGEDRFFFDGVRDRTPEERELLEMPVTN
ncbi:MAG: lysine 2,3-aminomutase [Thermoanaerobaculia bacterium]|nr:lysine 2,3-aminomutase [Thermoanaerobaculia bacterium]